jgi:hypothetical protein
MPPKNKIRRLRRIVTNLGELRTILLLPFVPIIYLASGSHVAMTEEGL